MDYVKDAFQKVKQDISLILEQITSLNISLEETKKELEALKKSNLAISSREELSPPPEFSFPADNPKSSAYSLRIPTNNLPFSPLKGEKIPFSTGNEGVPADRQTDQQTDQQTEKAPFDNAITLLNSLDFVKKDIRNKFKRITDQEFLVFSTIYQLTDLGQSVDYKSLSHKLNLTESSIRDYVGKLIKKGIPIEKTKINNKLIQLSISGNLKKITSLPVILQLRDL